MLKKAVFFSLLAVVLLSGCAMMFFGDSKARTIVTFDWEVEMDAARDLLQAFDMVKDLDLINGIVCNLKKEDIDWIRYFLPIRYVEEDIRVFSLDIPRPEALTLWPSEAVPAGETIDWGLKYMHGIEAQEYATGKGVSAGVIDTGICLDHPDLTGAIAGGVNIIDGGSYADDNNHGTYISTVIAARKNGVGIVGVAPDAMLYAIKVLDEDGSGYSSDVVAGYQWALDQHKVDPTFKCVNLSLGSYYQSQAMAEAMEKAAYQGMGTFAAAGNDGRLGICYPARNEVAVCVGAHGDGGGRMNWSNFGPALEANGIMAPGDWVLAGNKDGNWNRVSGTSISTPYITGIHLLLDELKWAERKFHFAGASQADSPDRYVGYGNADAVRTIQAMLDAAGVSEGVTYAE